MSTMNASGTMELQILKLININEQEIKEAQEHLRVLTDEKQTLEKFLEVYHKRTNTSSDESVLRPQVFMGKTIRDSLHIIAKHDDDLIIVAKEATRLLKEANVFGNPANASSVVYSALKNPEFTKVSPGVFHLSLSGYKRPHNPKRPHKRTRKPSLKGLSESVKLAKSQNPNITKNEAKDLLIKQGFNFEGRNPGQSVNRVWINLGYDKVTQQPLFNKPEVNVIQVPDEVVEKIIT